MSIRESFFLVVAITCAIGCYIGGALLQESAVEKTIERKLKEVRPTSQCQMRGKVML